uniref:Uncharacterized protein isoform X1 n=1 Tax=Nicotiana tabacum TaxID=4097 RepID=A0A1S4B409_TOBAC|nr:PREDICTED: uncharacterized protein LOC107804313 isoform X1 [Nicotiana tabacum]
MMVQELTSHVMDCIGALDGTHVKARLSQGQEIPYIGRKGYPHMKGYMAPYKGDNVRYHLAQFRRGATRQLREPRGRIEKFNYLHSSCRNIVERTFGVWKARWSMLRDMPFYHIDTQRDIVLATMAIHNYIRKKCNMDDAFRAAENERYVPFVDPDVGTSLRANNNINAENVEEQSDLVWMGLHNLIANEICEA